MRIVHCVTVAPNRCGLYGTAKDLVSAEKSVGIDAGIIDASVAASEAIVNGWLDGYPKIKDKAIKVETLDWARKGDCFVRHSYVPMEFLHSNKPIIMAMHGRPESSFRLEAAKILPAISTFFKRGKDDKYKAFMCFWKEYMSIWRHIIPGEKLFYIPAPVDLEYYAPFGKPVQYGEHNGEPNIMVCDIWREDVMPFNVIMAASLFKQKYCPTAKLHIVGLYGKHLQVMLPILEGLKANGVLGVVSPMTPKIREFYAAADILITPQVIATRTVREPLACGVPVVAGSGNRYTPYTANPMDVEAFAKAINACWQDLKDDGQTVREYARKMAETCFNPQITGNAVSNMLEKIL